jgi:hypothetical protein
LSEARKAGNSSTIVSNQVHLLPSHHNKVYYSIVDCNR